MSDYSKKLSDYLERLMALDVASTSPQRDIEAALAEKDAEIERLREHAHFLSDRISELEFTDDLPDDFMRDWMGHVEPALRRLRTFLWDTAR